MGNIIPVLILVLLVSACSSPQRLTASIDHSSTLSMIWPMSIKKISRHFKFTKRDYHDGIDIPAPSGTAIYSVERGKVVYSGRAFKGYGNMLLIEHKRGLATLYAHCKKLFVRSGDFVDKGEKIALVGRTGRASAPHLHFEVRINKQPVDPMEFLP